MPTPNLYLATQKLFKPHRWFSSSKGPRLQVEVEHWEHPIAGTYEYRPGRGWYLIATDDPSEKPAAPVQVKYSRVLRRNLLAPDYESRKKIGRVKGEDSNARAIGFFRLDDGIAWVNYLDSMGDFIPGPYQLWCIDSETKHFRPMLKGDDPAWQSRHSSQQAFSTTSRPASPRNLCASPQSSRPPSSYQRSSPSTRPSSSRNMSTSTCGSDYTLPTSPSSCTFYDDITEALAKSSSSPSKKENHS